MVEENSTKAPETKEAPPPVQTKTVSATSKIAQADLNGDGHISDEETDMYLEFKRKELEDQDAQRDAMRKMTWFALFGMLLYPFAILITSMLGYSSASGLIADIAPTYFVSISVLVAAFFGADAVKKK